MIRHLLLLSFASFCKLFALLFSRCAFCSDKAAGSRYLSASWTQTHGRAHITHTYCQVQTYGKLMSLPVNFSRKRLCWGLWVRQQRKGPIQKPCHSFRGEDGGNCVSENLQRSQDKFLQNCPTHTDTQTNHSDTHAHICITIQEGMPMYIHAHKHTHAHAEEMLW